LADGPAGDQPLRRHDARSRRLGRDRAAPALTPIAMADLPDLTKIAENPHKFERYLTKTLDTTMDTITVYGLRIIGATFILIIGWIVANAIQNWVLRIGRRSPKIDVTIFTFLASVCRYVVLILTVVAMLSTFGVQ